MKIANGVDVLELTMNLGQPSIIHPTLLWDNEHVLLIDTGIPGQLHDIQEAMAQADADFEHLDTVILTHQDVDHIGSLNAILKAAKQPVKVLAHEADRPYIEGTKPFIKLSPERIQQLLEILPEERKKDFSEPLTTQVDQVIADGEILPYFGGMTVIFTPGHTPGHISLYLNQSKILIAGDAMVAVDGKLHGPREQVTPDMETALESLKKFTNFDIDTVVCYHGGVVTGNINEQIRAIVSK